MNKNQKLNFVNATDAIAKTDKKAKGEKNDCVVRAFMNACDITYDEAHEFVAKELGRQPGQGTTGFNSNMLSFAKSGDAVKAIGNLKVEFIGQSPQTVGILGGATEEEVSIANAENKSRKVIVNLDYPKGGGRFAGFTVGKFLKVNQKGTFIMTVPGHALTVKDGVLFDNADRGKAKFKADGLDKRRCEFIFKLTPTKTVKKKK
jgi:hypothetical protein